MPAKVREVREGSALGVAFVLHILPTMILRLDTRMEIPV
jgi:hypothetical protein